MGHYRGSEGEWGPHVTTRNDADHPQVHVARSLAVATGGGAVAVVTAAEVSTLTTLSSLSLQKVRAPRQQTLLQVCTVTFLVMGSESSFLAYFKAFGLV